MTFDDFLETAMDVFGMEPDEAATLAEQMFADGYDLDRIRADDEEFWADAADYEALDLSIAEYEPPEQWRLDRYFPDDDYLDPGDVWEVSAEAYTD